MQFDDLIQSRSEWIEKSRENNFDFDAILSGLYTDSSHFIYELIQNAEDANASYIEFRLTQNQIEVIHDGDDFTYDDVDGVTSIGKAGKRDDVNKIGTFGVGFKSVFAITKTPFVHSGKYHFKITDFVLPTTVTQIPLNNTTKFVFPFNLETEAPDKTYHKIKDRLETLGEKTLLFLKHIREIRWSGTDSRGSYARSPKHQIFKNAYKVSLNSNIDVDEDNEVADFFLFQRPVSVGEKELNVEVAYKIEKVDGIEVVSPISVSESKLVVFFPTERTTFLNFLVQAPFKTTPNREGIPLEDDQNQILLKAASELVAESIISVKKLRLLNVSFLQVLPIRDEHLDDEIYSVMFEKVKEIFTGDEALLPTMHGGFSTTNDAALARAKDLATLLSSKDLKTLYRRSHWLHIDITADRTPFLHDYLMDHLEIPEFTFEGFSRSIDGDFLKSKSEKWLCNMYKHILKRPALIKKGYRSDSGILRRKPIIRLSRGQQIEAFDIHGDLQVYLPTPHKTSFNTIKKSIAENKHARELFREWGISEVDSYAEIVERVIPKYNSEDNDISIEEYFEDLEFIYQYYLAQNNSKWSVLKDELADCSIILSTNTNNEDESFRKPGIVYHRTPDLLRYFLEAEDAFFVSQVISDHFEEQSFVDMLNDLGCNNNPIIYEEDPKFSWQERSELRTTAGCSHDIHVITYFMHHFDEFVKDICLSDSHLVWNFLAEMLAAHGKGILHGEYKWFYYSNHYASFDSRFKRQILGCDWLLDTAEERTTPTEISLEQLHPSYPRTGEKYENLISVLSFKLNEISDLEQRTGGKFIPQDEYELFLEWKAEQENSSDEDEDLEETFQEDEIETSEETYSGESVARPDLINQPKKQHDDKDGETSNSTRQNTKIAKSSKTTGRWGEEYVYEHLRKKTYADLERIVDTEDGFTGYLEDEEIEVKWLNKSEDQGIGYDFVVLSNGFEISYIEVKSTIGGKNELHRVSAAQWGLATELANRGEGGRYKVFVVVHARSKKAKIIQVKNPVELWRDGKLYAHPIHIRV